VRRNTPVQRGPHGQWGPEQRHNSVTHDLIHGPFVAVHGRHHAFQDWVEELTGFLGITIGQQFHRAFEIGKQHRDLLAFAFEGTAGGEDFLGEVRGRVGVWSAHGNAGER
jgi:hypothetical protein